MTEKRAKMNSVWVVWVNHEGIDDSVGFFESEEEAEAWIKIHDKWDAYFPVELERNTSHVVERGPSGVQMPAKKDA